MSGAKSIVLFIAALLFSVSVDAQISTIENLLNEQKITEARKALDKQLTVCRQQYPDSLHTYIPILGRIVIKEKTSKEAILEVESFVQAILKSTTKKITLIDIHLYLAEFYGRLSEHNKAYETYTIADQIAANHRKDDYNLRGKIQNNLATTASRLNDMKLNAEHQSKAEVLIKKASKPDYHTLYLIYNAKGSVFYYAYQLDSAAFYFNKALEMLGKSDKALSQKLFSKAVIFNNLAGIYTAQGNNTAAMDAMKETINNLTQYLNNKDANEKKEEAREFLYEAMDNLAGIYKSVGDYYRALNLLQYAYSGKMKDLPPSSDAIFKSEILLGQLYYAIKDFKKARRFLQKGLESIPSDEPGYYFWLADGHYTLALMHNDCGELHMAQNHFEIADSIYQLALQGASDNIYLELLNNMALFYAKIQKLPKALSVANKAIQYTEDQQAQQSLQSFHNKVTLANIFYKANDYKQALSIANEAIRIAHDLLQNNAGTLLDSVSMEQQLTKAILLKSKATFLLLPDKNANAVTDILQELQAAKSIFDRRKFLLSHEDDLGQVNDDYRQMTDFINKLQIELYHTTNNEKVLGEMISLHESAIYQKIRSNINRQKSVSFLGLPPEVQDKEKRLLEAISQSLQGGKNDKNTLDAYFSAEKNWQAFQLVLKEKYPDYFKAKYASPPAYNLNEIAQELPDSLTVVRFFYIDQHWYAWVADKQRQYWIALPVKRLDEKISSLIDSKNNEAKVCSLSYALYLELWQPIADKVNNHRVMVIPDGALYHLSFEILSPTRVEDFKSLYQSCLLNQYAFSYHYSLWALEPKANSRTLKGFSGFIPLFSDKEKSSYEVAISQSSGSPDYGYLSLLPLPFSEVVAKKAKRTFGGKIYTGASSTKDAFVNNAGKSAIIHLGTHAEFNDEYPEYSRLIFAKDLKNPEQENSLYLYDIYQYDMSSNITVLTACETGKPGFFPGEGMISMAHAFSYSGSSSILTGLWKIDEQSSAQILEYFYQFLNKGFTKDVALQQAKLAYLKNAQGRMLAPDYWAGMVIMGDISAVKANRPSFIFWISMAVLSVSLILLIAVTYKKEMRNYEV